MVYECPSSAIANISQPDTDEMPDMSDTSSFLQYNEYVGSNLIEISVTDFMMQVHRL